MKPAVEQVLAGLAGTIGAEVIPAISEPYAVGHAGAAAMLGIFVAQDYDRAAEIHARAIQEMQALFRHASASSADDRLAALADEPLAGHRVSALGAQRARLQEALIALHAAAEAAGDRALERSILEALARDAHRRALFIPPMG